jgi:hypothetical protein
VGKQLSDGKQVENMAGASQLEDFSPPGTECDSRNPVPAAQLDVLELVVKFELMGADSQARINELRNELPGQTERQLAGILVERSYLTEEELETVVLARYLLACAKLTMSQLELVMDEIRDTRAPLWVALVAKGWLKMGDVV